MRGASLAIALIVAAAAPCAVAASSLPPGAPALSRQVACAGGDTMLGLVEAWAEGFRAPAPGVAVSVDHDARLAADGFRRLLAGQANCVTFVREPFPSELAAFQARFGHAPTLIPVAGGSFATRGGTHAIAVFVNAGNPLNGLTLDELDAVLADTPRRGHKPVRTWGDLGLTGDRASRPIHVYGMLHERPSGDPPGMVNFVQQRVMLGGAFRPDIAQEIDRPGEQALAAIVRRVGEDADGLGYSGFGYAAGPVRALPLAERPGEPFVTGDPDSVRDRRYPLSRRIYILIDRTPGQPIAPALRAFLSYALGPEGQATVARDPEGFLPLTPAELADARKALQ